MRIETCRFCRFYEEIVSDDEGQCRRYAPKPLSPVPPSHKLGWTWPKVLPEDWCGEFEDRK